MANNRPTMTRAQFDHICSVLRKKKIEVTPENIAEYMQTTSNQRSKFYKGFFAEEAEKANQLRLQWSKYLKTIQYRFKLFSWHFIIHKKGFRGRIGRFDIIRAKFTPRGDSNQG